MAQRRQWGTGSMRELSPGIWRVIVTIGKDPATGKRRQLTGTVHGTKRQAQARLDELRATRPTSSGTATVAQLVTEWWPTTTLAPATEANWRPIIDRWIVPHLGAASLRDVTPPVVTQWHRTMEAGGASVHAAAKAHMILGRMFSHAQALGWAQLNPVRLAPRPKVPTSHRRPPGAAVGVRLLDVAAELGDPVVATWLRLVLVTGARRGEILALRWTDVDWVTGAVRIARSLTAVASGQKPGRRPRSVTGEARTGLVIEGPTKTHAERDVILDAGTMAALLALLGLHEQNAEKAGATFDRGGFMFPATLDGRAPLRPEWATKTHRRLCVAAGVEGVRLHDLRHRAAAVLMAQGGSAQAAAGRLGHAKVSMTMDVYGGAVDGEARNAADVLARSLERP